VNANNTLRALFTLPSCYVSTTVRVIAISNSLDLTARRSISSALSDLAPDNLTFTAYGSKEMVNIVKARVQSVKEAAELGGKERVEMDEKAIELVGRKVEASNGDLRMCLNVMVEAVGTTETEWKKKSLNGPVPLVKVTLTQVLKALTSSIAKLKANAASNTSSGGAGSAIENKIRSLNVQVRMILLSLLVSRQRIALGLRPAHLPAQSASHAPATASKELEVTLESLLPTYAHILSHPSSPFAPAGQTDFMDLIMQAEVIGIISLHSSTSGPMTPTKTPSRRKNGKNGGKTVIELLVREEELKSALIGDEKNSAVMQSEIRAMWMREETRWGKAMEGRKRAMEQAERVKAQGVVGFNEE
jgi:cell division control protein 6